MPKGGKSDRGIDFEEFFSRRLAAAGQAMVKTRRVGRDRDGEGGGKGKGKGGKGKAKGGKSGPSPLEEARKLQKKAERATGRGNFSEEAVRLYREAIEIYLSIYNSGTASRDDQYEVMIAMAECYTYTAEISADSVRGCDNITQENAIKENVVFLCKQAAEIYKKVMRTPLFSSYPIQFYPLSSCCNISISVQCLQMPYSADSGWHGLALLLFRPSIVFLGC